jgi:hypothetical protein
MLSHTGMGRESTTYVCSGLFDGFLKASASSEKRAHHGEGSMAWMRRLRWLLLIMVGM